MDFCPTSHSTVRCLHSLVEYYSYQPIAESSVSPVDLQSRKQTCSLWLLLGAWGKSFWYDYVLPAVNKERTSFNSSHNYVQNITLPSLMFSKMVPAFTPDNVSALGAHLEDEKYFHPFFIPHLFFLNWHLTSIDVVHMCRPSRSSGSYIRRIGHAYGMDNGEAVLGSASLQIWYLGSRRMGKRW